MSSTIVVAWTPDEFGKAALDRAIAEARLRLSSLVLVNGTRGDAFVDGRFAHADEIAEVRDFLGTTELTFEVRQTVGGEVSGQVLGVAEEVDAIMIVLALHRRSPVGKLLMGSVAQRVLLGAECAVLAVKPSR